MTRQSQGPNSKEQIRTPARLVFVVAILALVPSLKADDTSTAQGVQPIFRPSDRRPRHDDAQLNAQGIAVFESKRLKLYTDVPAVRVKSVLPAVDAAYDALCDYFGSLPPNPEKTEFQVTGYLMADKELFRRTGLLPEDLPRFLNGRHRNLEFWVNEQQTDYYRRHLAIHEFTHCFMFAVPDVHIPSWYMEGMAELFGTHRVDEAGRYHFRVMPDRPEDFDGLGRIPLVRAEIAENHWKTLEDLRRLKPREFVDNTAYAWSWAACEFFDAHPRYSQRFRELGRHTTGSQFDRMGRELFAADRPELDTEWSLFSHHLQYGYDLARAAITFEPGKPLSTTGSRSSSVAANGGWQASGVLVRKGTKYEIVATGEVTLGRDPKPWVSQPQGISIVYSEGRPIGTLLASIDRQPPDERADESMLKEIVVGRKATFVAETTGTLYLRINDRWGSLADNEGHYQVEIREIAGAQSP